MEYHEQLLVRISQMYYEQNLNQGEIAKILHTSRPTVSRLLEEAKQTGVVEIVVHDPIKKNAALSRKVRERFNLRDAIIIKGNYDYHSSLQRCCEATVQLFGTIVDNNCTIGIAWGAVPELLSNMLENEKYYNIHVVQMVGCLGTGNPTIDGLELAISIARKLNGTYSLVYSPVFVRSKEVAEYMLEEPQNKATLKRSLSTDIFITGIGSLDANTTLQVAGFWNDEDREQFMSDGAVGHLLARPYDINGKPVGIKRWYTVGAELPVLNNIDWSIGVTASAGKALATLGAINGKYINTLIADEALALELLRLADEQQD